MKPLSISERELPPYEQHSHLTMFAELYVLTGDPIKAAQGSGVQNPVFRIAVWSEQLLASGKVRALIREARKIPESELAKKHTNWLEDYYPEALSRPFSSGRAPKAHLRLLPPVRNEKTDDLEAQDDSQSSCSLHAIAAGSWAGQTPPEMPWIVPHWIPSRAVTLLAGDGGTGKSLMVQQLLSCLSLGVPFMGMQGVTPARCMYLNCEDDVGELHRRQAAIASAIWRPMEAFADYMLIVPRLGAPDNALGTFDAVTGQFKPTPLYEFIRAYCIAHGVRVLALDNVAHLYSGNENIRGEVTAFLNALSRLALEIDGAVILIGHPAKADGSQYSGSTAWENGVRNRLYLCRPNDDDGRAIENRRILTRSKSNVASIGDEIVMVWHEGAFQPPGVVEAAVGRDAEVEAIFEACLKAANAQRRNVSHATGSNYAPKLFATMSESRGVGRKALAAAMERLFSKGRIVANQPLWFNEGSRRQVHGIAFAAT